MRITRNEFLKVLGVSAITTLGGIDGFSAPLRSRNYPKTDSAFRLGLASYTLRKFSLGEVIKISQRLNLSAIALKSMHMPLEGSSEEIRNMAAQVRSAGLALYGAGVIYMKSEAEVKSAFAYAVDAGLHIIVGVPNHDLLPLVNDQVRKDNIKLAIHNHGPGDDLYSSPSDVYAKIKDLDKRIGLCIDIGHVERIGQDPVAMIEKYKERLYDMHMKDVDKAQPDGTPVEMGRGVIDIPKVLKTLKKINYQGTIAFEYEKDGDDPVPGLAESVGYVRGIIDMI
jgi:inosose dehydratase